MISTANNLGFIGETWTFACEMPLVNWSLHHFDRSQEFLWIIGISNWTLIAFIHCKAHISQSLCIIWRESYFNGSGLNCAWKIFEVKYKSVWTNLTLNFTWNLMSFSGFFHMVIFCNQPNFKFQVKLMILVHKNILIQLQQHSKN